MDQKNNQVVGFLLLVGMMFSGAGVNGAYSALERSKFASSEEPLASSTESSPSISNSTPERQTTVAPVDNRRSDRDIIVSQYSRSDAAYSRRNANEHLSYLSSDWVGVDSDGSREGISASVKYYASRFSDSDPKRFVTCSLSTTIEDITFLGSDEAKATIKVIAKNTTISGESRAYRALQKDSWKRADGTWKCYSSRTSRREKTN